MTTHFHRRRGPLPLDEIRRRLIPHQRSRRPGDFEMWSLAVVADDDLALEPPQRPAIPSVRRFSLV